MPEATPAPRLTLTARRLGRSEIRVPPIGAGFMAFSGGWFGRSLFVDADLDRATPVVRAALEGGIRFFDTAEMYGRGASEHALARGLRAAGAGPDAVVATKWLPVLRTAHNLVRTIGRRQSALEGWPISLYQIHLPASLSTIPAQMRAMATLQRRGRIGAIGVSNFSARQMERAARTLEREGMQLATNQVPISLLDRAVERNGLLEAARGLGVTLIAYGPLAGGVLTGRYHADPAAAARVPWMRRRFNRYPYDPAALRRTAPVIDALREIGEAHGARPGQVALNWLVTYYGDTVIAIPGASRPSQAEESAGAMRFALREAELERLAELARASEAS